MFEPLAQHYGLETEWLDITNDFNVAIFFATCGWDGKKWYPLTKADTEGDSNKQYGVLFHIPQWQAEQNRICDGLQMSNGEKCLHNSILPIGFQPFMRCHSQYAYGIHMKEPFPLQEDFTFEKLHFRHNEKLSKAVFDLMDGGRKIYPQEGLEEFQDVIQDIKNANFFSEEAFQYALEKSLYFNDADAAQKELRENQILGYPIRIDKDKHPFTVSRQRIRRLNMKYEGFSIEKTYGIQLFSRKVMYPK